jgi:hypothetical protein
MASINSMGQATVVLFGKKYVAHKVTYNGSQAMFDTDLSVGSTPVCIDPATGGPSVSLGTAGGTNNNLTRVTLAAGGANNGGAVVILCAHGTSVASSKI